MGAPLKGVAKYILNNDTVDGRVRNEFAVLVRETNFRYDGGNIIPIKVSREDIKKTSNPYRKELIKIICDYIDGEKHGLGGEGNNWQIDTGNKHYMAGYNSGLKKRKIDRNIFRKIFSHY